LRREKSSLPPTGGVQAPLSRPCLGCHRRLQASRRDVMKTKSLVIASLVAASLMAGGTAAAAKHHGPQNGAYYDYAKLVRVTPVPPLTRLVEASRPERECWHAAVVRQARSDANPGGVVLRRVVGGGIGNRSGGGNGRKIATVAGSIAGAALGQEMNRRPRHSS